MRNLVPSEPDSFSSLDCGVRLLHVEDNQPFARLLQKRLLHACGDQYHFTHAGTLAEAREILATQKFDVILVDLGLPDSDGLATLDQLRQQVADVPVVVLTAASDEAVLADLILHGAQDYLDKSESSAHYISRVITYAIDRKRMENALLHLSRYDGLTQLVNRTLFQDRLEQALSLAARKQQRVALMFIDLDRFKAINDNYGHHFGDVLLQHVAQRLKAAVRESDTVARLGGDEFCILLQGVEHEMQVARIASKVLDNLKVPCVIQGRPFYPRASIGIAISNSGHNTPISDLLSDADVAMYRAKQAGGGRFEFFTQELKAVLALQTEKDRLLRDALIHKQFETYLQPQWDLQRNRLFGAEVLVRWNHPTLGILPPASFIPYLEQTGLIAPMTEWLMERAGRLWVAWLEQDLIPKDARLAINMSAALLQRPDCPELVTWSVSRSGMPIHLLDVEIAENVFIDNPPQVIRNLQDFSAKGIGIAIDDFGIGYSSLNYLKYFRADCIKLDCSFVAGLNDSEADLSIAKAMIQVSHDLGIHLIAEGVDAEYKQQTLQRLGYRVMQGYHFSVPLTPAGFAEYLCFQKQQPRKRVAEIR